MGILSVDLNNIIDLDDTNYYEDYPRTVIHVRLLSWHSKFEKRNTESIEMMRLVLARR